MEEEYEFVVYRCPKCGSEDAFTEVVNLCKVTFKQKPFEILEKTATGEVVLVKCERCRYEGSYDEFIDTEKEYCGDCGKKLTPQNMWSEYTCRDCARELGLLGDDDGD